jgi:signal transduction histidine kinase
MSVKRFPGLDVKLDAPEILAIEDPLRSLAALRCVQEAMTNVAKHAKASTVHIVVKYDGDHLDIRVEDDGTGMGDVKAGYGLRGMRERIEGVDGTLEISNAPGGGTVVHARIPFAGAP